MQMASVRAERSNSLSRFNRNINSYKYVAIAQITHNNNRNGRLTMRGQIPIDIFPNTLHASVYGFCKNFRRITLAKRTIKIMHNVALEILYAQALCVGRIFTLYVCYLL